MVITGILEPEEGGWVSSVDALGVYGEGDTVGEALEVIAGLVRIHARRDGRALDDFKAIVTAVDRTIYVRSNQPTRLAMILLRHQREIRGWSLADVQKKLGASSRNSYARYEQGTSIPTVDKFVEILDALLPDYGIQLAPMPRPRARKRA